MKSLTINVCLLFCTSLLCSCTAKAPAKIVIVTDFGDIEIELYDQTPQHRDNFIKLAKEGYYDGTLFHRVIRQFMIQGGDPDSKNARPGARLGNGGPKYTVPAEFVSEYIHQRGALAAARQGDNVNPTRASSGSQFYIVQGRTYTDEELDQYDQIKAEAREVYKTIGGAPHLDGGYTVFGRVIKGMEVVDQIADMETGGNNRPKVDVKIRKMKLVY